jgi:hypothetical protein
MQINTQIHNSLYEQAPEFRLGKTSLLFFLHTFYQLLMHGHRHIAALRTS